MTCCHLLLSLCALHAAPPVAQPPSARPGESVIKVTASVRVPNPVRPWLRPKTQEVTGTGVIIDGNRILTNAHLVEYATEVQIQLRPGGDKIDAQVVGIGPEVDLALLSISDKKAFAKHPPLPRARKLPGVRDTVEVYGFPIGGTEMSVTKGTVSRITYTSFSSNSFGMVIQVSAAINPGNSGGPAVVDGRMVGLVFSRLGGDAENIGYLIPNEEIELFLDDIKDGRYDGKLGDATDTHYQRLENKSLREALKLDREVQGVMACPGRWERSNNPFEEFDIITRIGEYDLDNSGMVQMEGGLSVYFLGLIPKVARKDRVPVTVLRKGKKLTLALPVTTKDTRLIRDFRGEQPSYFIHGPLTFSPVKEEAVSLYFRMNATLGIGRSPLLTRRSDRIAFPGEELVVVTSPFFDHKIVKGYLDPVGQVVKEVNGVKVKNLRHLVEILRDSKDEFLEFRFAETWSEVLIFRRAELNRVTEEILEDNGIASSRRGSRDMLAVWKKEDDKER